MSDEAVAAEAEPGRMTLVEHLTELRRRLIVAFVSVLIGGIIAFSFYNSILDLLLGPYTDVTGKTSLLITDPLEGFVTRLKIAAYGGLFLASPVVLWEVWRFITPGLNRKEKKYAIPFIISSILLFMAGAAVAMVTFKPALRFLVGVGGGNLETFYSPSKYLGLITLMIIAFGISFEFPIVLVFLELAGVLTSKRLRKWRRPAIVVIVGFAAVITPSQDPYSLFAMAAPMYLFYESAILIGRILKK
jgi:sec-independent protein translocase protein TatC